MFLFNLGGVNVSGQKLNHYSKSSGGGMNGGYRKLSIDRFDDTHALYSTEGCEWHFQDPEISEYLVDVKILDDIRKVFISNRMNTWHNKTFTDMFISDGESHSYSFGFDDDSVYFSSQYYPEKYSSKLSKLNDAIKPYTENMQKLPGLVLPKPEEEYGKYIPCKGGTGIYVSRYSKQTVYYKIVNDTSEDVEYSGIPVIKKMSDGTVVFTGEDTGESVIYANYDAEDYLKQENMLEPGIYELTIGDYSCEFEIR